LGFAGSRFAQDHDGRVSANGGSELITNCHHALARQELVEAEVVLVVVFGALDAEIFPRRLDQGLLRDHPAQ